MTEPADVPGTERPDDDVPDVSAPGSPERADALARAVADVEAGARAEIYDTDGENTEP